MATHLKSLEKRARLNEGHVKAAGAYKARMASLTSERAELRARMQNMMEEAMKLKSDMRHTSMAGARAEGREEKARDGLRVVEGEFLEVGMGCRLPRMICGWLGMGYRLPRLSFRWSGKSCNHPRMSYR